MAEGKPNGNGSLADELETAIRQMVRSTKAKRQDRMDAIKAGINLLAVRNKMKEDPESGFFGQ
jgi:hypothetical protein